MNDLDDLQLRQSPENDPSMSRRRRTAGFWIPAILLVLGVIAVAYVLLVRRDRGMEPAPATAAGAKNQGDTQGPLGGKPDDIVVPPLDESDALVRQLVAALSSHPRVAAWLTTDNLIRNFTAVVHDVSAGMTPARRLSVLAPERSFRPVDRDGDLRIDAESYTRYNSLADAVASVDAAGAARLYATLKPRIEEAYTEQGFPNQPFDQTIERAIVHLLQTPIVSDTPVVEPRGADVFAYADPRLESLSSAQKHLLRMGPRNVRVVHEKLREIAIALGIDAARLPPAATTGRNHPIGRSLDGPITRRLALLPLTSGTAGVP
jgi:hypothetical protein